MDAGVKFVGQYQLALASRQEENVPGQFTRLTIKAGKRGDQIRREKNLASRYLQAEILRTTDKALLVTCHAVVEYSETCLNCDEPIRSGTRWAGYCQRCLPAYFRVGVSEVLRGDTPEIRDRLELNSLQAQIWLPKSAVTLPQETTLIESEGPSSPELSVRGEFITLRWERYPRSWNERFKTEWGGRWNTPVKGRWNFPKRPHIARQLQDALNNAGWMSLWEVGELTDLIEQDRRDEMRRVTQERTKLVALGPPSLRKTDPWEHQTWMYHYIRPLLGGFLFADMATGKSKVVIDAVQNDPTITKTLILAPRTVVPNWSEEIRVHGADGVDWWVLPLVKGTASMKAKRLQRFLRERAGYKLIVIVGHHTAKQDALAEEILRYQWPLVVWDEAHVLRTPGSDLVAFARNLRTHATRVWGLTGTPMGNTVDSVWSVYSCVAPNVFPPTLDGFRSRYAIVNKQDKYTQVVGAKNEAELHDKMYTVAVRCLIDEVLPNLPPIVRTRRYCTLGLEGKLFYERLQAQYIAEYHSALEHIEADGEVVSVEMKLQLQLRLQQIAAGFVKFDDKEIRRVDNGKRDALRDWFLELDPAEPRVVFFWFKESGATIREVAEECGLHYAEVSGTAPLSDLAEWQRGGTYHDGKTTVLGVQYQAGGVGINLVRGGTQYPNGLPMLCKYGAYFDLCPRIIDVKQSRSRIRRPGAEEPIVLVDFITEDTVDVEISKAVEGKMEIADLIVDGLTRRTEGATHAR